MIRNIIQMISTATPWMTLSLIAANIAWCADIESHEYMETVGDAQQVIQWCVEKSDDTRMLWKTRDECSLIETSGPYATVRWRDTNTADNTSITALREGNAIVIKGMLNGIPIDHAVAIDEAPWFQSMSWSLHSLILSRDEQTEFWALRPDTMKAHKLVAKKAKKETLHIGGDTVPAIRIEVRLKGMLSPFWHSNYWFRRTDGVWLRYEGPSGPPGRPPIVIEYRKPSDPCNITEKSSTGQLDHCIGGVFK
jgi:hypothetical protein